MKFRNWSQALLVLGASALLSLGVVSCGNNYPVAYLYTTGVQYNQLGGFTVANTTGALVKLPGTPIGSGGTDPRQVVVTPNGIYLYVVNAGCSPTQMLSPSGEPICSGTAAPSGSNVSFFTASGNGTPKFRTTYKTSGFVPVDAAVDATGTYLFVLDAYGPTGSGAAPLGSATPSAATPCADPVIPDLYHPAGEVTVFSIASGTGNLAAVANGSSQYFPVGCNPVALRVSGSSLYVAQAGSPANAALATGDQSTVLVATIGSGGSLTAASLTATGGSHLTGIAGDRAGKYVYVLDAGLHPNDPAFPNDLSYVIPYSIGAGGALSLMASGPVANTSVPTSDSPVGIPAHGPTSAVVESEGRFLYVANQGVDFTTTNPNSNITAWLISQKDGSLSYLTGEPFGTGSGAQCILEDPSNQYIYTGNFNDSTVTGRRVDHNAGVLNVLPKGLTFGTVGNVTACAASGHTQ